MTQKEQKLARMYSLRFPEEEFEIREKLWNILIEEFLQKYISDGDTVLDLGGGLCLFINNVRCRKKYVVDLNPNLNRYAGEGVIALQESADNVASVPDGTIDVVFVSNFFEHLKDMDALDGVLVEIARMLKPDGLLLVIQPNIKYAYREYWDAPDHYLPISDTSLTEMLMINDFQIQSCYPKFMPWSPKESRLSSFTFLLKIYLRMPFLWKLFGKQMFIFARKLPASV